jgi:hypothetical protein
LLDVQFWNLPQFTCMSCLLHKVESKSSYATTYVVQFQVLMRANLCNLLKPQVLAFEENMSLLCFNLIQPLVSWFQLLASLMELLILVPFFLFLNWWNLFFIFLTAFHILNIKFMPLEKTLCLFIPFHACGTEPVR